MTTIDKILAENELVLVDASCQHGFGGTNFLNKSCLEKISSKRVNTEVSGMDFFSYIMQHDNTLTIPEVVRELAAYIRKIREKIGITNNYRPRLDDDEMNQYYRGKRRRKVLGRNIQLLRQLESAVINAYDLANLSAFRVKKTDPRYEILVQITKLVSLTNNLKRVYKGENPYKNDTDERLVAFAYHVIQASDIAPCIVTSDRHLGDIHNGFMEMLAETQEFDLGREQLSQLRIYYCKKGRFEDKARVYRDYAQRPNRTRPHIRKIVESMLPKAGFAMRE